MFCNSKSTIELHESHSNHKLLPIVYINIVGHNAELGIPLPWWFALSKHLNVFLSLQAKPVWLTDGYKVCVAIWLTYGKQGVD